MTSDKTLERLKNPRMRRDKLAMALDEHQKNVENGLFLVELLCVY